MQDFAYETNEKYKEGRFILEREMINERAESKRDLDRPRIEVRVVTPGDLVGTRVQ